MNTSDTRTTAVVMLGTFGVRPKGTLKARALSMASALRPLGWNFRLITTPWDQPADAGARWIEDGIPVHNTQTTRPLLWPLAVREMIREASADEPALIHIFKPKGFGDLAGRRLRSRAPLVVDMDDWEGNGGWNDLGLYGPTRRLIFDWQERTLPALAGNVTAASRTLVQRAIDLGVPADRVHYVPNGLTSARYLELAPKRQRGSPNRAAVSRSDGPRILVYTRFVEFDPAQLARVLALVLAHEPETRMIVGGGSADGTAERQLQQAATRLQIENRIELRGWMDPARLAELADSCDVAYHPFDDTLINRAKSSVKLLELMATGIPIVASAVGENREFIRDGAEALLTMPGDDEAAAAGLCAVTADPSLGCRLSLAARARVEQEYLWERLAKRVDAAYRQALDGWSGRTAVPR